MNEYRRIGQRLKALRRNRGETQEDLGWVIGCAANTVSFYESGKRKLTLVDLQKIADHYGVPITYFLGRETEEGMRAAELKRLANEAQRLRQEVRELESDYMRDAIPIPLIGTVPGGYPDFRDQEEAEEFYPIRRAIIHEERAYCLKVTGNSMTGCNILDGDIVFVDSVAKPKDGDIVIARRDDEAVIRVYREDDNGPYLEAANKGYKRLRLKEAEIIGVVVESRREHRRRNRAP